MGNWYEIMMNSPELLEEFYAKVYEETSEKKNQKRKLMLLERILG